MHFFDTCAQGAENQIIIEVKKTCRDLHKLLGAHDWAKFLKNPTENDQKTVSKVFFCRFKSGAEVEGAGKWLTLGVCWTRL